MPEIETYVAPGGRHVAWTSDHGGVHAVGRTEEEAISHLGRMLALVTVVSRRGAEA